METVDKIIQRVHNGQVIDDDGTWVSINKRIEVTKKIIDRLSQGKVLCNGRWVTIAEARKSALFGATNH